MFPLFSFHQLCTSDRIWRTRFLCLYPFEVHHASRQTKCVHCPAQVIAAGSQEDDSRMVMCCDICGSLMICGKCSNPHCGKPVRIPWGKEYPKQLKDAVSNGKSRLITATRGTRAADLGGPPIGMIARDMEVPDSGRKERVVQEKVCTMTQVTETGRDGFASWECSRCLEQWEWPDGTISVLHYCPNCGSHVMAGEKMIVETPRKEQRK